ncbi:amidohydrolase family protein [Larkinella soli]|uniref:amidohydrolase family protein n=1 Tax=Larkinella soli TaxID=1770527 RepID=UPI000FFC436F|nr:amidohydrolase family protein [Larkinella soli]
MKHQLIIRNAQVITLDRTIGDFSRADLLIEDDRIAAVGPDLEAPGAEEIDADGMIAIPGLIDTHRHVWQGQIRGITTDATLLEYMQTMHGTIGEDHGPSIGAIYRPQDVYIGNLVGTLEALSAGITTILDWSHIMNTPENADAAIRALKESGTRAVFGYGFSQTHGHLLDDARRVRSQYFTSGSGLITMALAIRGPEMSSMDDVRQEITLARELGIPITLHAIGGGPVQPVLLLHQEGLLGPDLNFAHANGLTDEELDLIAGTGGSISITPEVEMQMGIGLPVTGRAIAHGLRPSLGADVVTAVSGDLFAQMRMALQTERALQNDRLLKQGQMPQKLSLTTRDALEWATINGAKALGLENRVGTLTPGKQADLVLIRTSDLNLSPVNNPVGQVVQHAHPGNVDSVFVAGKAVKRNGKLVQVDWNRVRQQAVASRDYLFSQLEVAAVS